MAKVIKVENLSKAYQLGDFGTGTLSRDLERVWARIRGKEDPFLKIGETNDRTKKGDSDIVWSLKDLYFEIEQGDAVGIIGRNGAGKSTLLKILSRVTSPTSGSVKVKGRVASLLEVGTGFHPELSGRENIYLNGAILGMRKAEIKRKFDEIVDFAGVQRYIDTPVKRYSSGMYVRLAFAVAAHLESEILIVDEVLAVGDAEFQKKCLGKMGDISRGEGRTVLFVSHNMGAVKTLCGKGILLGNGQVSCYSNINEVINKYNSLYELTGNGNKIRTSYSNQLIDGDCKFKKITIIPNAINECFDLNKPIEIRFDITRFIKNVSVDLKIIDSTETVIIHTSSEFGPNTTLSADKTTMICKIPEHVLNVGAYTFNFILAIRNSEYLDKVENHFYIEIQDESFTNPLTSPDSWTGKLSPKILLWS